MARAENKDRASTATRFVADIVRLLRKHAGLTQEELGPTIGYTGSAISAVETGAQPASEEMLLGLEREVGLGLGILKEAVPYIRLDKYPSQFKDFALIEEKALSLSAYETLVIDGLFQTPEYARALIDGGYPPLPEHRVDELVEGRMARKALFDREPTALIEMILEESVLRRTIGSRDVMRAQLLHLIECAQRRNVLLQVLPLDCGLSGEHPGLRGSMKIVETLDHVHVVYLEVQNASMLFSEPAEVAARTQRYAKIRSLALSPDESLGLIEKLAGEA